MPAASPTPKRTRPGPDPPPAQASKRVRTSPAEVDTYERLKDATFPVGITALPHVMKQIDRLLMTPEEALVDAAATAQMRWLDYLLTKFDVSVAKPLVAAASRGHVEVLARLLRSNSDSGRKGKEDRLKMILAAATAAGGGGHLKMLLALLRYVDLQRGQEHDKRTGAANTLKEAAGNGQLTVTKFMVKHARTKRYTDGRTFGARALPLAIAGRHKEVVEFLLKQEGFRWDLAGAFAAAVDTKQSELVRRVEDMYPKLFGGHNLFVHLARDGHLSGVKYIYKRGYKHYKAINNAFFRAALHGKTSVVEFLLDTARIGCETFDRGFEGAAGPTGGTQPETTLFLYSTQRASLQSLHKVFEVTDSVEVIQRLYENEYISSESVVAAFKRASGCGNSFHVYGPDQAKIVMELCEDSDIPVETMNEAFVIAAQNGRNDVLECIRDDHRISSKSIGEAFAAAAGSGDIELMTSLYDAMRVSPEAIFQAFTRAPIHGNRAIIAYIVKLLSEDRVPRVIKYKAFVSAAKRSKYTYMLEVLSAKIGEWPLDVLKEAHDAALYCAPRNYISKLTCDQLFSSQNEERFQAMVKWMEKWPRNATKK
ncbi:hypothetical protein PF010_g9222 [Phytophthora fragariae]|uniref:Uncharacterized protein n=1 Tax=Phytophthora fragariae TaxID=53985 RepID=A0A6G0LD72_9STRA|nr:hypothetical protein PF010_g9222 [Phytophthora fragariae]KAE9236223.1 hypothetical protein PF004_g8918 [Phytophthora fragariae]